MMKTFLKENWLLVVTLFYVLSPIDFIPDDLPLIGSVDDTFVVLFEIIKRYREFKNNKEKGF